jgi:cytoskeleton protein RodZ
MSDFSMTEPSDYAGAQNPADQGQPTPGMQLAMRRHEFNWSVEQVASQLNLAPRQVLAMEADDYGALPGMAVARGFIRSYAKLLKLDSTPMLAQIAKAPGSAEQAIPLRRAIPSTTFQPHRGATRTRQGGPGRLLLVAGVVIVAALAAAAYNQRDQIAGFLPASLFKLGAPSAPDAEGQKDGKLTDTDIAPPLTRSDVGSQPAVAPRAPAGMTPQLSPVPLSGAATSPAPQAAATAPQAANSLVLTMRQDSWVDVKRADNTTLTSRVMRAGSSETFELTGPLMVTVGNARGVDATVRGTPLDLVATTRNNVARVNVK